MRSIIALVLACLLGIASGCHYSCLTCQGDSYTNCVTCPFNIPIYPSSSSLMGTCSGQVSMGAISLGIVLLVIVTVLCGLTHQQQAFEIWFALQAIGLFSLMQINWTPSVELILTATRSFMFSSTIGLLYKKGDDSFLLPFKLRGFFREPAFYGTFGLLGILVLISFITQLIVPLLKLAKRKCDCGVWIRCMPDWVMERIQLVARILYLFLIQEMVVCFVVVFSYGDDGVISTICLVLYCLSWLYFLISSIFQPFQFFRNKMAQSVVIIERSILPLFLLASPSNQWILIVLNLVSQSVIIVFTHKKKVLNQFNRVLLYRISGLFSILLIVAYYGVETKNIGRLSGVFGVIVTIGLMGYFYPILLEIVNLLRRHMAVDDEMNELDRTEDMQGKAKKMMEGRVGRQKQKEKEIDIFIDDRLFENRQTDAHNITEESLQDPLNKELPRLELNGTKELDCEIPMAVYGQLQEGNSKIVFKVEEANQLQGKEKRREGIAPRGRGRRRRVEG